MKRILFIARAYPHVSHTYINNDIEHLAQHADVLVLSPNKPMAPWYSPIECNYFQDKGELIAQARQFKPDFIIALMLPNHHWAREVSSELKIPFALKLHTSDYHLLYPSNRNIKNHIKETIAEYILTDKKRSDHYRVSKYSLRKTVNAEHFMGAFCIPVFKEYFSAFIPLSKLFNLTPRIFFDQFHDENINGKKIIALGSLVSRREGKYFLNGIFKYFVEPVDWYAVPTPGVLSGDIQDVPDNFSIKKYVPNHDMPNLYKKYKALLILPGNNKFVRGLPMSILEAQASGVSVIAPSLRPDFDDFVIKGGGYLYNDVSEIQAILNLIPNDERRNMGFEHAKKFDIKGLTEELSLAGLNL